MPCMPSELLIEVLFGFHCIGVGFVCFCVTVASCYAHLCFLQHVPSIMN